MLVISTEVKYYSVVWGRSFFFWYWGEVGRSINF